jgi:hypothetical protein
MANKKAHASRSPAYPSINLEAAIEKAKIIWESENHNSAPIGALLEHLGFSSATGTALRTIAALKQYGLLEDTGRGGDRKGQLTWLAKNIILDEREDSPERDSVIREAALKPKMHQHLWEKYKGSMPSDTTSRMYLLRDMRFSTAGANALLKEFKETKAFAKLDSHDNMSLTEDREDLENVKQESSDLIGGASDIAVGDSPMTINLEGNVKTQTVLMPIQAGMKAAIQVPETMTEDQWNRMMNYIQNLKHAVVSDIAAETNGASFSDSTIPPL